MEFLLIEILPMIQILLIVELFLLVVTLILVALSLKEAKGRSKLMNEMYKTARIISREEYFNIVIDSIQRAENYIYGVITGTKPQEKEMGTIQTILDNLLIASKRNVEIKYLFPAIMDRIYIAKKYIDSGCKVYKTSLRKPTHFSRGMN